jgi:hypothetical protein
MGFDLNDVNAIEGGAQSAEEYYQSIQRAINARMWSLQGSYGRAMMGAIEEGKCVLGRESATDYWGNRIPSRYEVQSGTKGSVEFVREHSGEDWAKVMDELDQSPQAGAIK